MAETSGFFDAQIVGGEYDRVYLAEQFANYFRTLVGNGVFISPTNQLKVSSAGGLKVSVSSGRAYINGYWYENDEAKVLTISANQGSRARIDSIKLRYSNTARAITVGVYEDETNVVQTDGRYELKLAEITVNPLASQITELNIKDTRTDESVCGFVKGLIEVVNTEDLFSQYNSMFTTWFSSVQSIVTSTQYQQMLTDVTNIKNGTITVPNSTHSVSSDSATNATNATNSTNATHSTNSDHATSSDSATHATASSSVDNDFILLNQGSLSFVNKKCSISDSRITENSLADVYFTSDTEEAAEKAKVSVDTYSGKVELSAERVPDKTLKASIRIRVV